MHPEVADQKFNELDLLLSSIHKTDFIGEIGIDGSSRYSKSFDKQELIFDSTLRECEKAGGRIISIHSRVATAKVLSIIKKYPSCGTPILHWFSGSENELKEAINMKCFFSVNPLMLRSEKGIGLVSKIPSDLILPESDGPFATIDGKPIMPWEAIQISSTLMTLWGCSFEKAEEVFRKNLESIIKSVAR